MVDFSSEDSDSPGVECVAPLRLEEATLVQQPTLFGWERAISHCGKGDVHNVCSTADGRD